MEHDAFMTKQSAVSYASAVSNRVSRIKEATKAGSPFELEAKLVSAAGELAQIKEMSDDSGNHRSGSNTSTEYLGSVVGSRTAVLKSRVAAFKPVSALLSVDGQEMASEVAPSSTGYSGIQRGKHRVAHKRKREPSIEVRLELVNEEKTLKMETDLKSSGNGSPSSNVKASKNVDIRSFCFLFKPSSDVPRDGDADCVDGVSASILQDTDVWKESVTFPNASTVKSEGSVHKPTGLTNHDALIDGDGNLDISGSSCVVKSGSQSPVLFGLFSSSTSRSEAEDNSTFVASQYNQRDSKTKMIDRETLALGITEQAVGVNSVEGSPHKHRNARHYKTSRRSIKDSATEAKLKHLVAGISTEIFSEKRASSKHHPKTLSNNESLPSITSSSLTNDAPALKKHAKMDASAKHCNDQLPCPRKFAFSPIETSEQFSCHEESNVGTKGTEGGLTTHEGQSAGWLLRSAYCGPCSYSKSVIARPTAGNKTSGHGKQWTNLSESLWILDPRLRRARKVPDLSLALAAEYSKLDASSKLLEFRFTILDDLIRAQMIGGISADTRPSELLQGNSVKKKSVRNSKKQERKPTVPEASHSFRSLDSKHAGLRSAKSSKRSGRLRTLSRKAVTKHELSPSTSLKEESMDIPADTELESPTILASPSNYRHKMANIVRHSMQPYYSKKRINSKDLFRKIARHLTKELEMLDFNTAREVCRSRLKELFKLHPRIHSNVPWEKHLTVV
jgi:hypothetical protein